MRNTRLAPDPDAKWLSVKMVASDRTMRSVLDETVTSGEGGQMTESGRTACGGLSNIDGPLGRFAEAVDLAGCPRDLSGTYHSHVTTGQLLNPTHSLPDMANVVFRNLDVSVVVGAETADVFVAAGDREAMVGEFRNALGLDVEGPSDLVEAMDDGRINEYTAARKRVRSAFGGLFRSEPTAYEDLRERIRSLDQQGTISAMAPGASASIEPMYAMAHLAEHGHSEHGYGQHRTTREFRGKARRASSNSGSMARSLSSTVANTAVGLATRRALLNLVQPRE